MTVASLPSVLKSSDPAFKSLRKTMSVLLFVRVFLFVRSSLRQVLTLYSWLALNLLFRPGSASASVSAGTNGVCDHALANSYI